MDLQSPQGLPLEQDGDYMTIKPFLENTGKFVVFIQDL